MQLHLKVPASTANLGPGYDRLGLALALAFEVRAQPAADWQLVHRGEGADQLPTDTKNLVAATYLDICHHKGWPATPLTIESQNQVPCGLGLGSSSTAVIAGIVLAFLSHGKAFSKDDVFQIAADLEGHPDNVGPAIFGGLQDCWHEPGHWRADRQPIHPDLLLALAIPQEPASTKVMRGLLPASYSPEDEERTAKAITTLLSGLAKGEAAALEASQWDVKHQPYRFPALPESAKYYAAFQREPAIAGAFLSGAGPTVAGWFFKRDRPAIERLGERMGKDLLVLEPDHQGTHWQKH